MVGVRCLFFGYRALSVPLEKATIVADTLYRYGIESDTKKNGKDGYCFILTERDFCAIKKTEPSVFDSLLFSEVKGIPKLLKVIRARMGLIVGLFLAILFYLILTSFVWEVRVEGMEGYDTDEVYHQLEKHGLKEGAFIFSLDTDKVAAACLSESSLLGWMNIVRNGTVVSVSCRPYLKGETPPQKKQGIGTNLIASCDAVVGEFLIECGRAAVVPGTVVKKGDLLVSGIYENAAGTKIVEAKGEVIGIISRTLTVTVPFENTVSSYRNSRPVMLSVSVFGQNWRLFSMGKENEGKTVSETTRLYLFDRIRLPVCVTCKRVLFTDEKNVFLNESEAMRLAYERMKAETTALLTRGELISRTVKGHFNENGYTLVCELRFSQNIAQPIEFSIK